MLAAYFGVLINVHVLLCSIPALIPRIGQQRFRWPWGIHKYDHGNEGRACSKLLGRDCFIWCQSQIRSVRASLRIQQNDSNIQARDWLTSDWLWRTCITAPNQRTLEPSNGRHYSPYHTNKFPRNIRSWLIVYYVQCFHDASYSLDFDSWFSRCRTDELVSRWALDICWTTCRTSSLACRGPVGQLGVEK